jgi:hypothetical protein
VEISQACDPRTRWWLSHAQDHTDAFKTLKQPPQRWAMGLFLELIGDGGSGLGQTLPEAVLCQPIDQQAQDHDERGRHDPLHLFDEDGGGQKQRVFEKGKPPFHPTLCFVEGQHLFGTLPGGRNIGGDQEPGLARPFCLDGAFVDVDRAMGTQTGCSGAVPVRG